MRANDFIATLVLLAATVQVQPAVAQARPSFTGSWVWLGTAGGHQRQANTSRLTINNDKNGKYCYDKQCWNVTFKLTGSAYTFSTDGRNLFEFASPEPGAMVGKFWQDAQNHRSSPTAAVSMQER